MVIVTIDGVDYEIPEAVEARMRSYYNTMIKLAELKSELNAKIREVARLDTISRKKGVTKEQKLQAWEARRELLNLYR